MKEFYYYLRDPDKTIDGKTHKGAPRVTICLLEEEDKTIARGVAICSILDAPNKKTGRTIARGRAVKALKHLTNSEVSKRNQALTPFLHKAMYEGNVKPNLMPYEQDMLKWERKEATK